MLPRDGCLPAESNKLVLPNTVKHPFEPRWQWRKRRHGYGTNVAWLHCCCFGSYPLARCLTLNSTNGVLQHQMLTVEVFFIK